MTTEEIKVSRIGTRGDKDIKPPALINNLLEHLDQIDEIYCVVKDKDGVFIQVVSGNVGGIAFSIVVLQKYLMDFL